MMAEKIYRKTPNGGDYSEIIVKNEIVEINGKLVRPCEIVEFKTDGTVVGRTHGFCDIEEEGTPLILSKGR